MKIASNQWKHIIVQNAAKLGITVDPQQVEQFARHALLLMEWNRTTNLTAIVDPEQLAVKHYLDSIAPLAHIPAKGPLLDVGTGGGFPGIPLKIMRPDQSMTLIDSVRKKISFIKHSIRQLSLEKIHALQVRVEDLGRRSDYAHRFHGILCRAFADPGNILPKVSSLLAKGGRLLMYLGPGADFSNGTVSTHFERTRYQIEIIEYILPISGDKRKIAILRSIP